MNWDLPFVPEREKKERTKGLTMVIDKGLCVNGAKSLVYAGSEYIDFVKFGFGTALISPNIEEKLQTYREAQIIPYFGGTLFELFIARNKYDDFVKFNKKYNMTHVEVSDGSFDIPHPKKLEYIKELAKDFTVLSEVGSKKADVVYSNAEWLSMMESELEAGSWKVIAEARESGTIGIYNSDGSSNNDLIETLSQHIDPCKIMWEAPLKPQQAMFIKTMGYDVNLGNISTNEVIALEALRLGLRGDTFFDFLPDELKQ